LYRHLTGLQFYEQIENGYPDKRHPMRVGRITSFPLTFLLAVNAYAQTAPANSTPTAETNAVPYSSVSQLNLVLSELQQSAQAIQQDLSRLRIEKWKTDATTKSNTQTDVDSIQRNLQSALPEMITELHSSPENLPSTFKLYRNLDALYDVFNSVVESAGAFGPRDDFQTLDNDLSALQRSRRSVGERMETLSNSKESELAGLRTQLQNVKVAEVPAPPPKKVIVDDTEPPKKPVKKKTTKSTKPVSGTPSKDNSGTTTQPQTQTNPNPQ
jgi:hypothetical protein